MNSIIFSILALLLGISIVQTIRTNAGSIPEDKEWDMLTDTMTEDQESHGTSSEELTSSDGGGEGSSDVVGLLAGRVKNVE